MFTDLSGKLGSRAHAATSEIVAGRRESSCTTLLAVW
jgi:hypothetical protein